MHTTSILISLFLLLPLAKSDEVQVKNALTSLMNQLLSNCSCSPKVKSPWNFTTSSNPCKDNWAGVTCDAGSSLKNLTLDGYRFSGVFNPTHLCDVQSISDSLTVLSLKDNNLLGENLDKISECRQLTRLFLKNNSFSGNLPSSFERLSNLKRLDISGNVFTGKLPELGRITGLVEFSAQDNQFSGSIPEFEFSNFLTFNVSNNNFHGVLPSGAARFSVTSFLNNPQLCGNPLKNNCSSSRHGLSIILMSVGFSLLGLILLIAIGICIFKKCKKKGPAAPAITPEIAVVVHENSTKFSDFPSEDQLKLASRVSKSEFSGVSSDQSAAFSSSLVMTSPRETKLDFEKLLKAPAVLMGRGNHGNMYKVVSEEVGKSLVVKRIRDWGISSHDFKKRMERLGQLKHPNVIPAIAFYSSRLEKLLIYEFQEKGNLGSLLRGAQEGKAFGWGNRLSAAATIADALAFMHQELHQYGVAHGNLKSSNILLNNNMEACISEYGLKVDPLDPSFVATSNLYEARGENKFASKADIYAMGVILLELLTGKNMDQISGLDLPSWVISVVKEEWTAEVFDRRLIQEGADEGRMVGLLQIAIKCVSPSHQARPSFDQIALMINTLKDEEERFMDVSGITSMYFQV